MKVRKQILYKNLSEYPTWKEVQSYLKKGGVTLQDDDVLIIQHVEAHYSENNSWDSHFEFSVTRTREETSTEKKKRLEKEEIQKEYFKERRYQTYLKLKQEFE